MLAAARRYFRNRKCRRRPNQGICYRRHDSARQRVYYFTSGETLPKRSHMNAAVRHIAEVNRLGGTIKPNPVAESPIKSYAQAPIGIISGMLISRHQPPIEGGAVSSHNFMPMNFRSGHSAARALLAVKHVAC